MTIEVDSNEPSTQATTPPPASTAGQQVVKSAETIGQESAPEGEGTSEQKEAAPSETAATEITEGKEQETESEAEGTPTEEPEAKTENEGSTKKKSGFQRRIDKLNARVTAKEQELEYWKQQALKGAPADPKAKPQVETKAGAVDGKPKPDSYETHAEYVEALTDWKVDQKQKERDLKQQQSRYETDQQSKHQAHVERVTSFKENHEDFDELMENLETVPRSPTLEQLIVGSDSGPELLYELAKNPAEAKRIAMLPPLACAREIGKIESRLASKASESKPVESKKITSAPKPITPIGSGGKGTVSKSIYDADIDQKTYERLRAEERKKRRQTS